MEAFWLLSAPIYESSDMQNLILFSLPDSGLMISFIWLKKLTQFACVGVAEKRINKHCRDKFYIPTVCFL